MKLASFITVCTLLLASSAAAQTLLGVSWFGQVSQVDAGTGMGTTLGSCGFNRINSMARHPSSGVLYAASDSTLITIDPMTGVGTFAVTIGISDVRGMAFDTSGTLYIIGNASPDQLLTVDVTTGNTTAIGSTGMPGLQGLAFNPVTGLLYGFDVGGGSGIGAGLVLIDPTTGTATDVDPTVDGSGNEVQAIGFAPNGTLYAGRNSLYTLDLTTGASTLIGTGGYQDLRGLDLVITGPVDYQVNQFPATLVIDGVATAGFNPAIVTASVGTPVSYFMQTDVPGGALWELAFTPAALVPRGSGAAVLANGDLVNIDLRAAGLVLLNNGFHPATPPLTLFQSLFTATTPTDFQVQLAVINPATPGSISMAQAMSFFAN